MLGSRFESRMRIGLLLRGIKFSTSNAVVAVNHKKKSDKKQTFLHLSFGNCSKRNILILMVLWCRIFIPSIIQPTQYLLPESYHLLKVLDVQEENSNTNSNEIVNCSKSEKVSVNDFYENMCWFIIRNHFRYFKYSTTNTGPLNIILLHRLDARMDLISCRKDRNKYKKSNLGTLNK